MKCLYLFILLCTASLIEAQKADALATAKGLTFTAASLSPEGQKAYAERNLQLAGTRTTLFSRMVTEMLLEAEAKATNSTPQKLIAAAKAKVAEPTAAQIQAVYDANQAALGGRPLDEVKKQIIAFIRSEPEQKAIEAYFKSLQTKYKVLFGKDVNAAGLKPTDMLVTIGTEVISSAEFETKEKIAINDFLWHQHEDVRGDLKASILSTLVAEEAKALNTDTSSIIAAEVTDKMREFTDDERAGLETALMKRLFAKYDVKILLKEPELVAQNVSVDDDPSLGKATAPVTVVMFTDFQCPACARTHPVLKKVIAEYGDKVRFVVRDNPLENIHETAFQAAMAANAANTQGKYFEYIEKLYTNQDALDKESLKKYAAETGLNVKKFELDLSDEKAAAEIRKDLTDGNAYGIGSTPTIFVNGVKIHHLSAEGFRRAIDRALTK